MIVAIVIMLVYINIFVAVNPHLKIFLKSGREGERKREKTDVKETH